MLFAGGTGVLPYLDLIYYLLKKAIYTVIIEKYKKYDCAKLINPYGDLDKETFASGDFKIALYVTYKSTAFSPGLDMI